MRAQAAQLARLAHLWLLTGSPTADQVAEKVIIDQLLRALPLPLRRPVSMKNPQDIASLVEAVKLAEATNAREAGERAVLEPHGVMEQHPLKGASRPVSRPAVPDLVDEPMATEPPAPTARAWMARCFLHQEGPSPGPSRMVKLDGKPDRAFLDSGSSVTLVQPTLVKPRPETEVTVATYVCAWGHPLCAGPHGSDFSGRGGHCVRPPCTAAPWTGLASVQKAPLHSQDTGPYRLEQ